MAEGDLQRAVGRSLFRYRTAAGLSQEAFAEILGYHRTYVGGLERGERNLSLRAVERLARRIDADPLELFSPQPPERDSRPPVDNRDARDRDDRS